MDSLAGQTLVKADGSSVSADEVLADKVDSIELKCRQFYKHICL